MPLIARIVVTIAIAAVAAFSVFGFLAAGEVADWSAQLVWRIGYGIFGVVCLAGIWMVWSRKKS